MFSDRVAFILFVVMMAVGAVGIAGGIVSIRGMNFALRKREEARTREWGE